MFTAVLFSAAGFISAVSKADTKEKAIEKAYQSFLSATEEPISFAELVYRDSDGIILLEDKPFGMVY